MAAARCIRRYMRLCWHDEIALAQALLKKNKMPFDESNGIHGIGDPIDDK